MRNILFALVTTLLIFCTAKSDVDTTASSINEEEVQGTTVKTAMFTSANGYKTSGTAKIVQKPDGNHALSLNTDFKTSSSPGLNVYLSSGSSVSSPSQNLGAIKAFSGRQNYDIKAGTDINQYSHVVIHCTPANLAFGSGSLK